MIANFHTHSTFCDGKNTPEEIVLKALEKGFSSIGFSGHGYTDFDLRYCMKDPDAFIAEIKRLKEKYKKEIQVYLGSEEDAFCPVDRSKYRYIIGSSHYYKIGDRYCPIDSSFDYFKKCLEAFSYDAARMAEVYFSNFFRYINTRKPDIIGHFDLITKFDETHTHMFLDNPEYQKISEKYAAAAAESGCIIEVNTGAIARGFRTTPYPSKDMLYVMKKSDAKLILASDSHAAETLDFGFGEAKAYLRDIGFRHLYTLYDDAFVKYDI